MHHLSTYQSQQVAPRENVNVVLQEGLSAISGSVPEKDLSTLFVRLGPAPRIINIETPITPQNQATRALIYYIFSKCLITLD